MEKAISTYEEIMSAAMNLSPNERVMLAEHLIESLDVEDQERINRLWAEEAERRNCTSNSGRRSYEQTAVPI
jgi:hypothetical protein